MSSSATSNPAWKAYEELLLRLAPKLLKELGIETTSMTFKLQVNEIADHSRRYHGRFRAFRSLVRVAGRTT